MYGAESKLEKAKEKTHDLNHDLPFSAHSIRSMFRVLGIYNFDYLLERRA